MNRPIHKLFALFLAALILLTLCACASGQSENSPVEEAAPAAAPAEEAIAEEGPTVAEEEPAEDFPIVGTWQVEGNLSCIRIQENGEILPEMVSTMTNTHNGVSSTTYSITPGTVVPWSLDGENFLYNNRGVYAMTVEGDVYKLVGEKTTYIRVGDLDYDILGSAETEPQEATAYTVGETLTAEGLEMTLTESGLASDIRVTSNASGITITSGPSARDDKTYVYLRGTLKNTGMTEVFPAIGGKVTLDGYEYDLDVDIINEDATPCSTIDPLDSVILLLYAHIPNELIESFTEGELVFGFNDNFENVDINSSDYLYFVPVTK